jgi:hypothetical protein
MKHKTKSNQLTNYISSEFVRVSRIFMQCIMGDVCVRLHVSFPKLFKVLR